MNDKAQHLNNWPETSNAFPDLMTEEELIVFLRIPEISEAGDYHNVIEHLKRMRNLPRIQLCKKVLYPTHAILQCIRKETKKGE